MNKRCQKRRGSYDPNEGRTLETCTGLERSLHGHLVEVNREGVLTCLGHSRQCQLNRGLTVEEEGKLTRSSGLDRRSHKLPEHRHPQTQLRSSIPRLDSRFLAARPFARSLAEIWSPRQTKRNAKHRITRPVFLRRFPAFETLNPICANAPPPMYASSDLASPLKFTAQIPESCHTRNTRSSESVSPRCFSSLPLLHRASVDLPSFSNL